MIIVEEGSQTNISFCFFYKKISVKCIKICLLLKKRNRGSTILRNETHITTTTNSINDER